MRKASILWPFNGYSMEYNDDLNGTNGTSWTKDDLDREVQSRWLPHMS